VEAAQKTETLQKIHHEWYQRLRLRVEAFVASKAEEGDPVSEERAQTLRQVLKTVLLGLVSPRLAGKGNERLTLERLVKLNFADADGELLKSKINRLTGDLTDFQVGLPPSCRSRARRARRS
jgi:DNA-binding transcriptional regulator YbjK